MYIPPFKLVEAIIKTIDNTVAVNLWSGLTAFASDTKWITLGMTIKIGAYNYKVTAISANISFTVSGQNDPTSETDITLDLPNYFHGSALLTLQSMLDKKSVMPFIWLRNVVNETKTVSEDNPVDREIQCSLYFMANSNFAKWSDSEHHDYCITPMHNLVDSFYEACKVSKLVNANMITKSDETDHTNFGVFTENGSIKQMFNHEMSGVHVKITLPFLRVTECLKQLINN